MAIVASEGEKRERHVVPAGPVQAVCFAVWDLGNQKTVFNGEEKVMHKILVGWETSKTIPSGKYQGKRYTIYKKYTLSLGDKANLRKDLESWLGRPLTTEEKKAYEVDKQIGQNCQLNIVHNQVGEKEYANINAIIPIVDGMSKLVPENGSLEPDWVKEIQSKAIPDEVATVTGNDE